VHADLAAERVAERSGLPALQALAAQHRSRLRHLRIAVACEGRGAHFDRLQHGLFVLCQRAAGGQQRRQHDAIAFHWILSECECNSAGADAGRPYCGDA
jgi:hypothetical protein